MRLRVPVELGYVKNGVRAWARDVGLAAHGRTEDEAIAAIRAGLGAWGQALKRAGRLDEAVRESGVMAEEDGAEDVEVIPEVVPQVGWGHERASEAAV